MEDIIEQYASVCKLNPLHNQKETKAIMAGQKINVNGYGYVDLKLPSRTLWATCNVGAKKPSDYGLYFQWGDTQGYTKEQVEDGKKAFTWSDYKWYLNGSENEDNLNFSKYTKDGAKLDLEDDAAHVNMGGDWHIPTPKQIRELLDNTIATWTTQDKVNGMKFSSKKNASKFIFIPAAGFAWGGLVHHNGDFGNIWSSMLYMNTVIGGQYSFFISEGAYLTMYGGYRCAGMPVRGVIG